MRGAFTATDGGIVVQVDAAQGILGDVFRFVVGGVVDVVPAVIQAALVLVIGVVVAFVLSSRVFEAAVAAGADERLAATPFDSFFGPDDAAVAGALAAFVKYLVLVVTLLVAIAVLNVRAVSEINQTLLGYAPRVLAALLVAVVGLVVGRVAYRLVASALAGRGLGDSLSGTTLDSAVDTARLDLPTVGGRVVEYYVYIVTLLVVADVLRVGPLERLFEAAAYYAPALVAAGAVVLLGVVAARVVGELVGRSATVQRLPATEVLSELARGVVVLVAVVVALDVAGVSTLLLVAVLAVVLLPVGVGVAVAVGIAFGRGSSDHVSAHIDDWT